jgi:uncharacterized repeat protein (TIGR03803 family)
MPANLNMKTSSASHRPRTLVLAIGFSLLSAYAGQADAMFTLLHTFGPWAPDGAYPESTLVQGADGNFYGTSAGGGQFGAGNIFRVTPSGILSPIYVFTNGTDGAYPRAALTVGSDGNFYGTAAYGGTNGAGTVFKVSTNGAFTPLYSFQTNHIDGVQPEAALVQDSEGNFWGTTSIGGTNGDGTIFMITPTGLLTNLHTFTGSGADGSEPTAPLIAGLDGNFYGTTAYGGAHSEGTVFRITPQGVWTNLHSFSYSTNDGYLPWAALVLGNDGNFYGTTYGGGTHGYGTVFKMTPNGTLTILYSFYNSKSDGGQPYGALVQGNNGNFYGTTYGTANLFYSGTNSIGTVFEITPGGYLTTLYSFTNGLDGANPIAGLVMGTNGNFYGAAVEGGIIGSGGPFESYGRILGGTRGWGTIFTITQNGQFSHLFVFGGGSEGQNPGAGLIQANNGLFYGVTERGGTNDDGTIFQMSADGTETPLYSFTAGNDGAVPIAALTQGNDGNLYGTTYGGGVSNAGAIFKITPAGVLTPLHTFTNGMDGGNSFSPLIQGTDGNFYGIASAGGGKNGSGTVFQITPAGALTTLHTFTSSGNGGAYPTAGLVQGADGQFYGATQSGGTNDYGTIFKISASGTFTSLYSFTGGTDGANPSATLTLGGDGNFYGVCDDGDLANGNGTIFKMTASGVLTPLYSLNGTNDGGSPEAPLLLGTDGNFYGTTEFGGDNGCGTVFQITTNGIFATIHSFTYLENGPESYAALVQATNGNFYIACEGSSSSFNPGTIFRLTIPPVIQSMTWTGSAWNISWNGQTGQKYQLQWNDNLSPDGWINLGVPISGQGPTINGIDPNPSTDQGFYRVIAWP